MVRALIRRNVRGLHLVCVPTGGLAVDLLIGAGCVETLETSAVTLDEFGQAPAFGRAVRAGRLRLRDTTCPAVYAGLQAGEKVLVTGAGGEYIIYKGVTNQITLTNTKGTSKVGDFVTVSGNAGGTAWTVMNIQGVWA